MAAEPDRRRRTVALMFRAGLLWGAVGVLSRRLEASRCKTTFWRCGNAE